MWWRKTEKLRKTTWKITKGTGLFFCVAHTISQNVGELVICTGPSMLHTITSGDLVLAERLSVKLGNVHRGDIVGCLNPNSPRELLCKRVIAKEADRLVEDVLPNHRVPPGHVFLMGDNHMASTDSRTFGPAPEGLVQIRLVFRIWPLNRFGWISRHWFWEEEDKNAEPYEHPVQYREDMN